MLKRSGLTRLQVYGLLLTLLLLAYGLMLSSAGRKSPTVDEQSHLFRGVAYLQEGATHFLLGHPLGASILAALPLLTEPELTLPLDTPAWADGNWSVTGGLFFWQSGNDPHRLIFLGRLPMIWLTLLLGGLLFHWGRLLVGPRAGLMAAALILLDPNLLAHGRLITGDVVLTFFFTLALYAFWQHLRQGRWSGLLLLGLALGLAAAVKYNAVLLLPIMGIWALAVAGQRRSPRLLAELVGAGLIAWLIVWVVYRFSLQPLPGGAFWDDLLWQLTYQEQTHGAYLWGDYSATGWWYYFPIAFLLKTPLLHLLLLLGGIAVCLKRGRRAAVFSTSLFLLWGALLYLAFSMGMGLNIGYRYLIPLLPLLWLFVAVTLVDWRDSAMFGPPSLTQASGNRPIRPERVFWLQVVIVITALVLLWTPLTWWPDYIPYFNQLAGRADSRWQLLV
jgi:4-amino-4-deoxy-L-arabinose transferase-like glycosyltransferase